jgi:hypothetical protein
MQRSGPTVPSEHDDAGDLRDLLQRSGPFTTVWANRPDQLVPAAIDARVRAIRDSIGSEASSPVADVDGVADVVADAFRDAAAVVVVSDTSGVLLVEHVAEPLRAEAVLTGRLPALTPVIEARQSTIPFIVVMVDRRGADLFWSGSSEAQAGSVTVEGDEAVLRKVRGGGWSHRRFQQRAENTWEHTAQDVAAELDRLAREVGARVILVASDVRMDEMLRKHLSSEVEGLLRAVPGSRSEDGAGDDRDAEIVRWLRSAVAEDTRAALQLFDQERGQLDRAADGAAATFEALRQSRVDTLLVHDDPDDGRSAFFDADEPGLVSVDRSTLHELGRSVEGPARLVDVAVRACLLTGGGVRVVAARSKLSEGIGALLRW